MISEALQREVLDLLKKLVACPSLSGREQGVADILKGYLTENGFSTAEIDRYGDLVAGVFSVGFVYCDVLPVGKEVYFTVPTLDCLGV